MIWVLAAAKDSAADDAADDGSFTASVRGQSPSQQPLLSGNVDHFVLGEVGLLLLEDSRDFDRTPSLS